MIALCATFRSPARPGCWLFAATWIVCALVGCGSGSGTKPIPPLAYSPEKAAADALALYDSNKDGKLDAGELKKCPSLAHGLAHIDKNGDKSIDAAELAARFEYFRSGGGVSLRDMTVRIVRGGKPAPGVTVTLEPESFCGDAIKPATAVSNAMGLAQLQTEGQSYPGVQIGFFKAIVSQKDAAGKELLPAKFNSATTLGWEIGPNEAINLVVDLDR